ncbi:hypothetical protein TIFTF001_016603 [Ficus carica]|uniref:Uncharacterized protein n=1 Tax=Ficus carica TaxID=3494 RepID=A0AA88A805_FICCA|nr:hypothetical protein TIFTF001_016603 [Ficus carica]
MLLCFRSKFILLFLAIFVFLNDASPSQSSHLLHTVLRKSEGKDGAFVDVVRWETARRSVAEETVENSSLILAEGRTRRRDPLNSFTRYSGGWNISNSHYWASVAFTAVPLFVIAAIWFIVFGLCLSLICLCYCCCPREPYGYSRTAYALSLILLILFTIAAMRWALIIVAAVMLFLTFLGFLFSVFGLRVLVYTLVIVGWILVAGTFILCGVFLLLHNVVADTCVAMDEWVQNPTAHTALDDILPCVDNTTAQETLLRTKDVTYQLVNVVDRVINNVTNLNIPPNGSPLYFNQSGPLMPLLCNPFNSDLSNRQCKASEVDLNNASQVWKNYVCEVSASGICATPGRLTPTIYGQMEAAVNVSYGLYRYGPFLVDLQDCTFVRETFTDISQSHCPDLRRHSQWIYIGLVMVSSAVMLSLIFWVIYARERRHRVYTKQFNARPAGEDPSKAA